MIFKVAVQKRRYTIFEIFGFPTSRFSYTYNMAASQPRRPLLPQHVTSYVNGPQSADLI